MKYQVQQNIRKQNLARITLSLSFLGSSLLIYIGFTIAYGVEVFSKDEQPFGIPYYEWVGKFWNWMVSLTEQQSQPPDGSCLINKSGTMVMLVDPSISGKHEFECDISSKDGLMIASWNGFFENNNKDDNEVPANTPAEQLSKMAKEQLDLGAVTSDVKVDGKSVAKLDEITSMSPSNIVNTKVNTMDNFTEIYAKPFNVTIPEDTYLPGTVNGTWPSGGHGWFTFLKPLSPGDHKVSYTLSVQGLGADNVASENTYTFHVK
ncbi:MAG TPA: hypothetical protein VF220_04935 [Nitrososphaeraceae archaeon]